MNEKTHVDLVLSAPWIVPIIPEGRVLEDCSIVIHNGIITALCVTDQVEEHYTPTEWIKLPEQVLMPGLVNSHCHLAMNLLRGYADDSSLDKWLNEYIWPAEKAHVNEEFVADGTKLAIAEMVSSGTTCFSDMYFYPEVVAATAYEVGMRAQICFPILEFSNAWAQDAEEHIHKGLKVGDNYRSNDLIQIAFGPHAPYTVSDETLTRVRTLANELQSQIQIHLHETKHEVEESIKTSGVRPLNRLHDLDILSPSTQCVHMTQTSPEDIETLALTGSHVVHCPQSNLKLNSGLCPTQALLDAGVNVSLGTDGAASNNNLDMFAEMKTAALIGKIAADNASAVSAQTALEMATINGAKTLGLDSRIGSLQPGKQADIIAVDFSVLQSLPIHNVISHLVYSTSGQQVTHAWVSGKNLLKDKQLTKISKEDLKSKAKKWRDTIQNTKN